MAFFKMLFTGEVPDNFEFKITSHTLLSYLGYAIRSVRIQSEFRINDLRNVDGKNTANAL